jgi:hypothetical protein
MVIVYRWRYDATYYKTVTDRYYRQLPFVLHLPTQFTLLWLLIVAGCWYFTNIALTELVVWALVIGAIAIPSSVLLTKKAIFLKYRVRPSFDSEACYSLSDSGGTIQQHVGETRFPWSTRASGTLSGRYSAPAKRRHPMAPRSLARDRFSG